MLFKRSIVFSLLNLEKIEGNLRTTYKFGIIYSLQNDFYVLFNIRRSSIVGRLHKGEATGQPYLIKLKS